MRLFFIGALFLIFYGCSTTSDVDLSQSFKWHSFEKQKVIGDYKISSTSEETPFIFKNYSLNTTKQVYVGDQIIEYATGNKTIHNEKTLNNLKFIALADIAGTKIKKNNSYDYEGIDSQENGYYIKATDYEYIKIDHEGTALSDSLIFSTGREYKKISITKGMKLFNKIGETDKVSTEKFDTYSIDSIKQELIYNGKSGNEIKILYREFKGDMIRPAFTQILQYDLKDSSTIRFKNFKIQILSANNEQIKYKVVED